jgi:hypothetical protein
MTNLKPFILKTSSVSFGSSRARARDGPPHPPEFRKMRMGLTSLPLKYSAISSVADFVTSSIITSPQKYLFYDFHNLGNIVMDIGLVNWFGSDGCPSSDIII